MDNRYVMHDDRLDYTQIDFPHELTIEEKDALLFALMQQLGMCVLRAKFEPSLLVLTEE